MMRIAALSVCLALIGFVQPLVAETRNGSVWQDGVLYSYSVCNGGATIVDVEFDRPIFGEYMVPSTLDGYSVVGIKGGFNIGRSFSSVIISDGVKVISGGVFSGCSMLEKVTLPKTLTELGGFVFSQCTNLTEIAIPNSVTTIEQNPFQGCSALGTGLVVIDGWAVGFNGIVPKSVEIPEGVESVAGGLFASQTNLTSITLPSTLRRVGRHAFSGCTGLGNGLIVRDGWVLSANGIVEGNVVLPDGTIGLAESVLWNNTSVLSVSIPESVKYIGFEALQGSSITNIDVAIGNGDYCSCDGVLFSKGMTTLLQMPTGRTGAYIIPDGVVSIARGAFKGSRLSKVSFPDSLARIDRSAFSSAAITNLELGTGLRFVDQSAFYGCTKLTKVNVTDQETISKIQFADAASNPFAGCQVYVGGETVEETVSVTLTVDFGMGYFNVPYPEYYIGETYQIDCPFGQPVCENALPEVIPASPNLIHAGWSVLGEGDLQCATEGMRVAAVFRKASIAEAMANVDSSYEYLKWIGGGVAALDFVNTTFAFYDTTEGCYRFQGKFDVTSQLRHWLDNGYYGGAWQDVNLGVIVIVEDASGRRLSCHRAVRLAPGESTAGDTWTARVKIPDEDRARCCVFKLGLVSAACEGDVVFDSFDSSGLAARETPVLNVTWFPDGGVSPQVSLSLSDLPLERGRSDSSWYRIILDNQLWTCTTYREKVMGAKAGYLVRVRTCSTNSYDDGMCCRFGSSSVGKWQAYTAGSVEELDAASVESLSWIAVPGEDFAPTLKVNAPSCLERNTYTMIVQTDSDQYSAQFNLGPYFRRVGGGELSQDICQSQTGVEVLPEIEPVAEGVRFLGWRRTSSGCYDVDYELSTFSISYEDTKGAKNDNPSSYQVSATDDIVFSPLSNVNGYCFIGWQPNSIAALTGGGLVVTACWERVEHVVSFSSAYGEVQPSQTNYYGDVLHLVAPSNSVWNGDYTNYVCIGSSIRSPVTNEFSWTVWGDVEIPWDVWRTNYWFDVSVGETSAGLGSVMCADLNGNPIADSGFYACGTTVVLTACPHADALFVGWTGVGIEKTSTNPLVLSAEAARFVRAEFLPQKVAMPTVVRPGGGEFHVAPCEVSLSCATPDATIYFSTSGSTPRQTDAYLYEGPFTISDTTKIIAFAVREGFEKSDYLIVTLTCDPVTLASAIGVAAESSVETGGDATWIVQRQDDDGADGYAATSGALSQAPSGQFVTSWVSYRCVGAGELSFRWKVECEHDDAGLCSWDHVAFSTNGVEVWRMEGQSGWRTNRIDIVSIEETICRWTFVRDDYDDVDLPSMAWLDDLVWKPSDPIPALDNPTKAAIKVVLEAAKDDLLAERITDNADYNDFRTWAGKVKTAGGSDAGAQGVMNADHAWISYALGQGTLLSEAPTGADLSVEAFEPSAEAGKFDFTVSVKDIEVGSEAAKENLKKVFGLEGAATLDGSAFSSDKVEIEFSTPVDGKVKFTAGPKDTSVGTFFMKVKMLP